VGRGSERGNVALRVRYEGSCLLYVSYSCANRQLLLQHTALTDWSL